MKNYPRQPQIAGILRKHIADLLRKECAGSYLNGGVSISDIRVSPGGFLCKIYLSSYMGEEYLRKAVEEANLSVGKMQSYLGKRLRMKKIPNLKFFIDDVVLQSERIDQLLKTAQQDRGE